MRSETQALHLAKMMQNHMHYPRYELALPLVKMRSSTLKKLSVNDVLLLDLKVLECILIEDDTVCANLVLQRVKDSNLMAITHLYKTTIMSNESKKYEMIKLSFGECPMKNLEVGNSLDMARFDLGKIMLIVDDKKIAQGALVNVVNEVGVKINTLF